MTYISFKENGTVSMWLQFLRSNRNKNGGSLQFPSENREFGVCFPISEDWCRRERYISWQSHEMSYVEVTHVSVCSCVTSLPRSALNWSWLKNYLKIAFITNLLFVNQIISVTLNWWYNILSCLQLLIPLFVWLVSEGFLRLIHRFAELCRHDLSLKMDSHFCFI